MRNQLCCSAWLLVITACATGRESALDNSTRACAIEVNHAELELSDQEPFPDLPLPEYGFQISTRGTMIPAGDERELCEVAQLPGDPKTDVFLAKSFTLRNLDGSHHLIVSAAKPNTDTEREVMAQPIGEPVRCYSALSKFGNEFQAVSGIQKAAKQVLLPAGVGRQYHGGQYIVFDYHYFNFTDHDIPARSAINFELADTNDCIQHISTDFAWYNFLLDIPGKTNGAKFTAECFFDQDVMLGQLTRHTHEWGKDFSVWYAGGPHKGEHIWTSTDYLHMVDTPIENPPVLFRANEGLRYSCSYDNPFPEPLRWGLSVADEMCNLFGDIWAPKPGAAISSSQNCSIVWAGDDNVGHAARYGDGFPKPTDDEVESCKASGAAAAFGDCVCDSCARQINACIKVTECQKLSLDCAGPDSTPEKCFESQKENSTAIGLSNQASACAEQRCKRE